MLLWLNVQQFDSKPGDVTAEFIHADIGKNENVYVDLPQLFERHSKNGHEKCLKLKKTFYRIRQSPSVFWKYTAKKLEESGPNQLEFDPCIFVGDKVIFIEYVDDLIL